MTSSRQDGDAWDLASSVGATATMVAAARAIATRAEQPIINDPFAQPLVHAVGIDLLTRLASGDITASDLNNAGSGSSTLADNLDQVLIDAAAVRTKFYDDFFIDATTAGIKQVVILASGLDSRAYRLPWPTGTVIYEVDQPDVIDFKNRTLTDLGAAPTAERRAVSVDLRDDWPAALRTAGFDPAQQTAWSAEGLLGYLPPEAQDRLLDTITELSASGSRLATESTPNPGPGRDEKAREHLRELSRRWGTHGFDPQMSDLAYLGERNEAAPYLIKRGWTLSGSSIADLLATHGFPPIENDDIRFGDTLFVHGTLTETG